MSVYQKNMKIKHNFNYFKIIKIMIYINIIKIMVYIIKTLKKCYMIHVIKFVLRYIQLKKLKEYYLKMLCVNY